MEQELKYFEHLEDEDRQVLKCFSPSILHADFFTMLKKSEWKTYQSGGTNI